MKVIFLDFDGVITIPHKWDINTERLKNLKKIIDATGAKIVISSSWRSLNVEDTINKVIGRPKRCPKNKMLNWFLDYLLTFISEIIMSNKLFASSLVFGSKIVL